MNVLLALLSLSGYNVYFADLHAHTEYSDGQGLPREAYCYARDTAHIDVLGLTDHTSYLNAGTYAQERELADEFNRAGGFVALAGQEFGSLSAFGHFSVYDAESLCPISPYDLTRFYEWVAAEHEPVQFNHPRVGDFNDFTYDRAADAYATTSEVVNGSGKYTPGYEAMYFEALRKGWHCAPVANQDNHNRHWGDAPDSLGQIPLTGILADTLTKEAIMDALLHRRVYATETKPASDRIRLKEFSVGPVEMGASGVLTDTLAELRLEVSAETSFRQIYLYRGGELFDSAGVAARNKDTVVWQLTVPVSNTYYVVKGVQNDSDHFWSAPIWLSYRPNPRTLEFYPNPLKTRTRIAYPASDSAGSAPDKAVLDIFDASGRPVFHHEYGLSSSAHIFWDGVNDKGAQLPNSIYLVRLSLERGGEATQVLLGKVAIRR
jgi:hypothetical protein